jgi:hypothetical protein
MFLTANDGTVYRDGAVRSEYRSTMHWWFCTTHVLFLGNKNRKKFKLIFSMLLNGAFSIEAL